jgi:hypothetical protein
MLHRGACDVHGPAAPGGEMCRANRRAVNLARALLSSRMHDVLLLALTAVLTAGALAYIVGCERL